MTMFLPERLRHLLAGDSRDLLTIELFQCDFDVLDIIPRLQAGEDVKGLSHWP